MSPVSERRARTVEIHYLKRLGYTDWIAARILWNLGFFFQPLRLLEESIEKYLHALWLAGGTRRSVRAARRTAAQSPARLFRTLPRAVREALADDWQTWARAGVLHAAGTHNIQTSEAAFRSAERLIRAARLLLDDPPRRNFLEEWEALAAVNYSPLKRTRLTQVMKGILALKNPPLTKRLKRQYARKIRQIAALFQRA